MSLLHPASVRMRRVLAATALGMVVSLATAPGAMAREGHGAGDPRSMSHGARADAREARQAERAERRAARFGQRREMPVQPRPQEPPAFAAPAPEAPREPSRPGRLSLDERRALRQQINEAGRDVYRPNPPP